MSLDPVVREFMELLAPFIDPGSRIERSGERLSWQQARRKRHAEVVQLESGPGISYGSRPPIDFRSFFGGADMADLAGLAHFMGAVLQEEAAWVPPEIYVDSHAKGMALEDGSSEVAGHLIRSECSRCTDDRTKVIFIRGRAGDGKSALLVQEAAEAAKRYLSGESPYVQLYINVQGRALSRLDSVTAETLQDLRANFPYSALSALARLGLIVPVIDGFDELLGQRGYRDAFIALTAFLNRLEGRGTIIVSGRSNFYDLSSFGQAAQMFGSGQALADFEIRPVTLLPWREVETQDYIRKLSKTKDKSPYTFQELRQDVGPGADDLLSSPFLLKELLEAKWDEQKAMELGHRPASALIDRLVEREAGKLTFEGEVLLSRVQQVEIIGEIAADMWVRGERRLPLDDFEIFVELFCDELGLDERQSEFAIRQFFTHAAFARHDDRLSLVGGRSLEFRHEFYFGYFLGGALFEKLTQRQAGWGTAITEAVLPPPAAEELGYRIARNGNIHEQIGRAHV